jgi:hypothetical protein
MLIKSVMLFANGNVACFDENGQQVPKWQKSLLCDLLRDMQVAGVIDENTQIEMRGHPIVLARDFIAWPKREETTC